MSDGKPREAETWIRRLCRRESGAAMVEFAITVPILMLIVWGVVDFARAYYASNSLAAAVREGARYAAVQVDPTANSAAIKTKVQQAYNAFGGSAIPTAKIFVYDSSAFPAANVTVKVEGYVWNQFSPIRFVPGGQIPLSISRCGEL